MRGRLVTTAVTPDPITRIAMGFIAIRVIGSGVTAVVTSLPRIAFY